MQRSPPRTTGPAPRTEPRSDPQGGRKAPRCAEGRRNGRRSFARKERPEARPLAKFNAQSTFSTTTRRKPAISAERQRRQVRPERNSTQSANRSGRSGSSRPGTTPSQFRPGNSRAGTRHRKHISHQARHPGAEYDASYFHASTTRDCPTASSKLRDGIRQRGRSPRWRPTTTSTASRLPAARRSERRSPSPRRTTSNASSVRWAGRIQRS